MTPSRLTAKVYVLRYWVTIENSLIGTDFPIVLPGEFYGLTQRLRLDDRLFLQGWDRGAPTGRARLVKIIGIQMPPTTPQTVHDPEVTLHVQQTWGWGHDATPDSVRALSWTYEPDVFPVLGRPGHEESLATPVPPPIVVDSFLPKGAAEVRDPLAGQLLLRAENIEPSSADASLLAASYKAAPVAVDTVDQLSALLSG